MDGAKFDRIVAIRTRFIRAQINAGHAFMWIATRDRRVDVLDDARCAYHAALAEFVRIEPDLDTDSIRTLIALLTSLGREIARWE